MGRQPRLPSAKAQLRAEECEERSPEAPSPHHFGLFFPVSLSQTHTRLKVRLITECYFKCPEIVPGRKRSVLHNYDVLEHKGVITCSMSA